MQIFALGKKQKREKKSADVYQESLNKEGKVQFTKLLKQGIQIQMSTV